MTPYVVVIPVRLASERLPRKPLLDIGGMTMIERVHARAVASDAQEVVVATDSTEIADVIERAGGRAEMTSTAHRSGTDRIAEVAERLGWQAEQIVVNVQGDEPLLPPVLIDQVAALLAGDDAASLATLMTPLAGPDDYTDPNTVKVVSDSGGRAQYFSRAAIPATRDGGVPADARRHIGIYAYRVGALRELAAAPVAPAEQHERLEQLRALWLGQRILVADAITVPAHGVDTAADLESIRALVRQAAQG